MMWGYHGDWGWWMVFGGLMMALFWGGLFLAVYWVIQNVGASGNRQGRPRLPDGAPLEIAARRLAAGEISEEEYDRIVARLPGGGAPA